MIGSSSGVVKLPEQVVRVSYGGASDQDVAVEVSERHFGTVVTSNFGWASYGNPSSSYALTTYADPLAGEFQVGSRLDMALDAIGAKSIRYPGGTEAWSSFKWRPADQVADVTGLTEIEKLHKVIDYCAVKGFGLDFTFPVRGFVENSTEEAGLVRDFIQKDLLEYASERDVAVLSIKIGNEYNVGVESNQHMSAESYAKAASALSVAIGRAVDEYELEFDEIVNWQRPDLLIEPGVIWRFGSADIGVDTDNDGRPDGNGVQDTFDVFSGFDAEAASFVDGIDIHHLTLDLGLDGFMGVEPSGLGVDWKTQPELLAHISARWSYYETIEPKFEDLELHSLAWSHPRNSLEIGDTVQSPIMSILQLHSLTVAGAESANSWLATGFSPNALVAPAVIGQEPESGVISPAGAAVKQMSSSLIGLNPISIDILDESEALAVVGYSGQEQTVLYLMNMEPDLGRYSLDVHDILAGLTRYDRIRVDIVDLSSTATDNGSWSMVLQTGVSREALLIPLALEGKSALEISISSAADGIDDGGSRSLSIAAPFADASKLTVGNSYQELQVGATVYRFGDVKMFDFDDQSISYKDLIQAVEVTQNKEFSGLRVLGTSLDDVLIGTDFADVLDGLVGKDKMEGGLGNDTYFVEHTSDEIIGEIGYSEGGGIDTIWSSVTYEMPSNTEILRLLSSGQALDIDAVGNDAPGTIVGNEGSNNLSGRGGNDQLNGNAGNDVLVGGVGRDVLVGGTGADRFKYLSIAESRSGSNSRDVINGFERGSDRIDLSAIDANTLSFGTEDAFTFVGFREFGRDNAGSAGQLRLQGLGGPNGVIVEADHNGDGISDFQLLVLGVFALDAGDFIL